MSDHPDHSQETEQVTSAQNQTQETDNVLSTQDQSQLPSGQSPASPSSESEKDDESGCAICHRTTKEIEYTATIACTHEFCRECMHDWLRVSPLQNCPLCRRTIEVFWVTCKPTGVTWSVAVQEPEVRIWLPTIELQDTHRALQDIKTDLEAMIARIEAMLDEMDDDAATADPSSHGLEANALRGQLRLMLANHQRSLARITARLIGLRRIIDGFSVTSVPLP